MQLFYWLHGFSNESESDYAEIIAECGERLWRTKENNMEKYS